MEHDKNCESVSALNLALMQKYKITSWLYDILDYPWERTYRLWRPNILNDVCGSVLEAGVGTGRNFRYYKPEVDLTGIDLSPGMLRFAATRAKKAACQVNIMQKDATDLSSFASESFDYYISTFMYCVMPDSLQPLAIKEMARILKPGGRFKIVEILFSGNPAILARQKLLAPIVQKIYGARFDRKTLEFLADSPDLEITDKIFLKGDYYLLIEGRKPKLQA